MSNYKDLTGMKFGRLTVIRRHGTKIEGNAHRATWLCICDCGNFHIVDTKNLTCGLTRSCGCFHNEVSSNTCIKVHTKHGLTFDKSRRALYNVWRSIKQRCFNPNGHEYHRYGGRGITICDEWKDNPVAFVDWCLSHGYKKGLEIDRIDNDGNYEPVNCQFISKTENIKKNAKHKITVDGVTLSANEWSSKIGYAHGSISRILKREGMDFTINRIRERLKLMEERRTA